MRYLYVSLVVASAAVAHAQVQRPAAAPDGSLTFAADSLRIKSESGQWQLWAGPTLLKDFGRAETDARAALALFRALRVNSRRTIGGVFECYLTDGAAPSSAVRTKQVVVFDSQSLRVEHAHGRWVLRDARTTLYEFGSSEADAQEALALCHKHGFNQIAVIGQSVASMKIPLRDTNPAMSLQPLQPARLTVAPAPAAPVEQPLVVRGLGTIPRAMAIDFRRLDVRREGDNCSLVSGTLVLAQFGRRDYEARAVAALLQEFRCTDLCRFGPADFGFFLSHGHVPRGVQVGQQFHPMALDKLSVKSANGGWSIFEKSRLLFTFGPDEKAAHQALAAIQHFGFDSFLLVGGGRLGSAYLMTKSR